MSKRASRKPKPYVFVFQLGASAKGAKGRVPPAFATAPCYYYRKEHEACAKKLAAIPEPELDEAEVDATFEAIDALVERLDLKPELYSDAEIEADEEHTEDRGFHAGTTFEKAVDALDRGGFVVRKVAGSRAAVSADDAVSLAVSDLSRHLDLTSLSLVLERLEDGAELTWHAAKADGLLASALDGDFAESFMEQVVKAAARYPVEVRDTLLLLLGAAVSSDPDAPQRALLDALPPPEDEAVKAAFEGWEIEPAPAKKAVAEKPSAPKQAKGGTKKKGESGDFSERIARIEAAAKKAGVRLPAGASESAIAALSAKLGVTLPDEVRAFYLAHDGGPKGKAVCSNRELLSLAGIERQWKMYKEAYDDGELEDDEVEPDEGVESVWWMPRWIPISYEYGGNHDVLDLAPAEGGTFGQIVAVWHDDASRTVEGASFLSWLEEQRWGEPESED